MRGRSKTGTPRNAPTRPQVPFAYKLVLNQWLLIAFQC